jgi:hypothetical protein
MATERVGVHGSRWGAPAAATGIAFAALALIAFLIAGGPSDTTGLGIANYFAANGAAVEWQAFLFGLSGVFLLWFAGTLASALRASTWPPLPSGRRLPTSSRMRRTGGFRMRHSAVVRRRSRWLRPLGRGPFGGEDAGAADGVDVAWLLRTIRSVAPHNVEDGQRIEIARMQQLLAERD